MATCGDGERQGVKVLISKPKRFDEAVHKILRAEASGDDLEVWHPAITDWSPIRASAAVAYTAGYESIQKLKQSHEIVFLAVETWQGQIDLTSRAMMQEIASRLDFKGYSREKQSLTNGELANKKISFTMRICIVDEAGRKVSDELFHPTKVTRLSMVPQYIERSDKPLAEPYPEAYIAEGVKMSKSMMEELKRGGTQVLFRGNGSAVNTNLDRAVRAEEINVAMMNILEPNLVGCGATSLNQLRAAGKSGMCSCLAQEVLHPDQPKLLMVWSMEDLLNIGMPAPEGKVIPILLSAYLPLVFMMNHQNLRPPTRQLILTLNHFSYTLVQCYSTLVGMPDQLQTMERRRMCEADRRAHMMVEIFEVASKFHLKYKEVFDRIQLDWGEKAKRRILRVHHDPATGGCRLWLESKNADREMTKEW